MAFARLDDGFHQDPKIAELSDAAAMLFVCAITWSVRNLTDGFIPRQSLRTTRPQTRPQTLGKLVRALVQKGLFDEVEGGWQIRHYDRYQDSRKTVEQRKQAAAERKRRSRSRRDPPVPSRPRHSVTTPDVTRPSPARGLSSPRSTSTNSPDGELANVTRDSGGRISIGQRAVDAFVEAAREDGYEPDSALKARVGRRAKESAGDGIPETAILATARECAFRHNFSAWGHILADVQSGRPIGRQRAPRAGEREDTEALDRALRGGA